MMIRTSQVAIPSSPDILKASSTGDPKSTAVPFTEMLRKAVDSINEMQAKADMLTERLATGEVTDIHKVMLAVEQVNIALQLTMQIRNKVIESYQEVMRMQI